MKRTTSPCSTALGMFPIWQTSQNILPHAHGTRFKSACLGSKAPTRLGDLGGLGRESERTYSQRQWMPAGGFGGADGAGTNGPAQRVGLVSQAPVRNLSSYRQWPPFAGELLQFAVERTTGLDSGGRADNPPLDGEATLVGYWQMELGEPARFLVLLPWSVNRHGAVAGMNALIPIRIHQVPPAAGSRNHFQRRLGSTLAGN